MDYLIFSNLIDFSKEIKEHYTTVERLMNGDDSFDYINGPEIVAKNQFTGLQDEGGIDIYEGDVVEEMRLLHDGRCFKNIVVEYVAPSFRAGDLSLCNYAGIEWKVIGNIHQNPELIKGV